jgi:hypothetical protein
LLCIPESYCSFFDENLSMTHPRPMTTGSIEAFLDLLSIFPKLANNSRSSFHCDVAMPRTVLIVRVDHGPCVPSKNNVQEAERQTVAHQC